MLKKYINFIILLLVILLLALLYLGTITPARTKDAYMLSPNELAKLTTMANDGNKTAIDRVLYHYIVTENKDKVKYWFEKQKEYDEDRGVR